jgi:hypothetical protein
MATFDKDTPHAIRRSSREGVAVTVATDASETMALDAQRLVLETQRRAGFRGRPSSLQPGRACIWRPRLDPKRRGRAVASGCLSRATALPTRRSRREAGGEAKHYASYLLQWEMMRICPRARPGTHDLWGSRRKARSGTRVVRVGPFKKASTAGR